ncbi:C-type lectin domain family 12 member B-like isoform X2 [Hypanus sabinus]|uniref:C-type lectin domain family 12 member B-like isoform X2 n=2 Tax=Hypanus sabinus TaxID=79690 RepID=UPI0028C39D32|nr:C-type lectin domain family 12 member B-like isoform X2 [Hypanus sabinus]
MDDSETYMNMKRTYTGSGAPSRDDLTCTDTDLNIRKVERLTNRQADDLVPTYSQLNVHQNEIPIAKEENPPMAPRPGEMPTTAQADDLDPTYSRLNLLQNELPIANEEDPPVASGPGEMSVTAQAGPHKEQTNENIGNRPDRKFCLLCLVTFVLFATVVGLSIHVSQIRQSEITSDRNYQELNSTLQSKISENSHLNFSRRTCLKNLSALNSNLSDLKRMHSYLRHQFTEMETKYRSVNETKAQICELLTSRKEHPCPQNWIDNENRCYFISSLEKTYDGAREHCSNLDARLLEINSKEEEEFVSTSVGDEYRTYWIGKCRDGNVGSNLLYKSYSRPSCRKCDGSWTYDCKIKHRFLCEKSDIPAEIRGLCQHPVGRT